MPNPNPCKQTRFKTDRKEACTANISLRVPPSIKLELKKIDGVNDKVRDFLEALIESEKNKSA